MITTTPTARIKIYRITLSFYSIHIFPFFIIKINGTGIKEKPVPYEVCMNCYNEIIKQYRFTNIEKGVVDSSRYNN